jgi:hypothetical protein
MIAYRGTASECEKYELPLVDFVAVRQGPDGSLWSTVPQSSTVIDLSRRPTRLRLATFPMPKQGSLPTGGASGEFFELSLPQSPPAA